MRYKGLALLLILSSSLWAKDSLSIKLIEKKPLQLISYEEYTTVLEGTLEAHIKNFGDSTVTLFLWDESHNVNFSRGDSSVTLVHQCTVVGQAKKAKESPGVGVKKLTLAPGESSRITYNSWECSSPFQAKALPGFYQGGVYSVQFRILAYDAALEKNNVLDTGSSIPVIVAEWSELLNSDEYWGGAFLSNKIKVTLKPKKRKHPKD